VDKVFMSVAKIIELYGSTLVEYGAFGLLTLAGWGLTGWFLYRDYKKKIEENSIILAKDLELKEANIKLVDVTKEISEARIKDLKETTDEYNEAITNVNHTLDKLTVALKVKSSVE